MRNEVTATYLLIVGIFLTAAEVPQSLGYLTAVIGYLGIFWWVYTQSRVSFATDRTVILLLVVIAFLFSINLIRHPSIPALIRTVVFVLFALVNLAVIPQILPSRVFFGVEARLSAVSVLIGLPTIVTGSLGPITAWHAADVLPLLGSAYPLTSIFRNPNVLAGVATIGALASGAEYTRHRTRLALGLAVVNGIGVYLTQSRNGLLMLGVAAVLGVTYHAGGKRGLAWVSAIGVVVGGVGALSATGVFPRPTTLETALPARIPLWEAGIETIRHRPLGWNAGEAAVAMQQVLGAENPGQSPHNSYLRVFIAGGVVAGVAYLALYLRAIGASFSKIDGWPSLVLYVLVIVIAINHLFEDPTLFGLSVQSAVPAIIFGYALTPHSAEHAC